MTSLARRSRRLGISCLGNLTPVWCSGEAGIGVVGAGGSVAGRSGVRPGGYRRPAGSVARALDIRLYVGPTPAPYLVKDDPLATVLH